jgi:hypothetical protein
MIFSVSMASCDAGGDAGVAAGLRLAGARVVRAVDEDADAGAAGAVSDAAGVSDAEDALVAAGAPDAAGVAAAAGVSGAAGVSDAAGTSAEGGSADAGGTTASDGDNGDESDGSVRGSSIGAAGPDGAPRSALSSCETPRWTNV